MANDYRSTLAMLESTGGQQMFNALGSGATGKYQFMPDTWADLIRRFPNAGLTPDGITDNSPGGQQDIALQLFNDSNNRVLSNALGRVPAPWETYAAHRFGATGAKGLLSAPEDQPAAELFSGKVIAQNPDLSGKTAGQIKTLFQGRFANADAPASDALPPPVIQPIHSDPISIPRPSMPGLLADAGTATEGATDGGGGGGADASPAASPSAQPTVAPGTAGLLGDGSGDWKMALVAGLMSLGEGIAGRNPMAGMAMIQNMQKQAQSKALQGFLVNRFGMAGAGAAGAGTGSAGAGTGAASAGTSGGTAGTGTGDPSSAGAGSVAAGTGTGGGIGAAGRIQPLTPQELVMLKMSGIDLTDINKTLVEGYNLPTGTINVDAVTGQRTYIPKVGEGKTYNPATGVVGNAPGAVESDAAAAAAKATAEGLARYRVDQMPGTLGMPNKMTDTMLSAAGTNAANQPKTSVEWAKGLREEFAANPIVRNRHEALTAYRGIEDAAGRDSLASDLNMVYGLAKLMDPGSVVREGETIMVNNTQGLSDKIIGAIKAINGQAKLSVETRNSLLDEARSRVAQHEKAYGDLATTYQGISTRLGLNPDDVIPQTKFSGPAAPVQPEFRGPDGKPISQADLQATATKYGLTVDEVKRRILNGGK